MPHIVGECQYRAFGLDGEKRCTPWRGKTEEHGGGDTVSTEAVAAKGRARQHEFADRLEPALQALLQDQLSRHGVQDR